MNNAGQVQRVSCARPAQHLARRKTLPGAYVLHKVYMVLNSLAQTGVPPAVHHFIDPFTYPSC